MATVNKNFRIKHGLVVEGTTGTINGENILTETGSDQYILDLVGGANLIDSVASGLDITDTVLSIDRTVVDTWYDASGAAASAQTAAESYADGLASNYDPAGSASSAQTAAQSYADGLASNYDAAGAASTAESNANTYTDTQLNDYTPTLSLDTTVGGYGYLKSADLSGYATETYVGTAIDNLVDGAPGLLDTLNEIAAAIADDANYATTMTTALAGKQNSLTAGSNIDITADTISVTGLDSADISDFNTAALSATSAAYDAAGSASSAQTAAQSYADGLASNYDAAGAASTAESNANSYADGLLNNLIDGTTSFTEINVAGYTRQVGSWASANTAAAQITAYQYPTSWGSAEFLVRIMSNTSGHQHSQLSKVLITRDAANNIGITEYGIVTSNGTMGDVTADVSGGNIRILVTPEYASSEVIISGTLLAYSD